MYCFCWLFAVVTYKLKIEYLSFIRDHIENKEAKQERSPTPDDILY